VKAEQPEGPDVVESLGALPSTAFDCEVTWPVPHVSVQFQDRIAACGRSALLAMSYFEFLEL